MTLRKYTVPKVSGLEPQRERNGTNAQHTPRRYASCDFETTCCITHQFFLSFILSNGAVTTSFRGKNATLDTPSSTRCRGYPDVRVRCLPLLRVIPSAEEDVLCPFLPLPPLPLPLSLPLSVSPSLSLRDVCSGHNGNEVCLHRQASYSVLPPNVALQFMTHFF